VYNVEMAATDHRELAAVLRACRAKVVLSGYPSPLYAELYAGWRTVTFDIANHAAGGRKKARKRETLWLNWR
jgi:DNA adenine methylase